MLLMLHALYIRFQPKLASMVHMEETIKESNDQGEKEKMKSGGNLFS
jgi:hypothetical protein